MYLNFLILRSERDFFFSYNGEIIVCGALLERICLSLNHSNYALKKTYWPILTQNLSRFIFYILKLCD